MGDRRQQGLIMRITSSQAKHADDVVVEVHLTPDESMRPGGIDREAVAEQRERAVVVGAPQVDQLSLKGTLEVEAPRPRESPTGGRPVQACSSPSNVGLHEPLRAYPQDLKILMVHSGPDLGLPEPVEALQDRLEAGLTGWGEDGSDPQAQAQPHDLAEGVRMPMAALEPRVVIKLGVRGQPHSAPMEEQSLDDISGMDCGSGPRRDVRTPHRDPCQYLKFPVAFEYQALDHVKGIAVGQATGQLGQVPSCGRCREASANRPIQDPVAFQDPGDRPQAGDRDSVASQRLCNRLGSHESQRISRGGKGTSAGHDALFDVRGNPVMHVMRGTRPIRPIHVIQGRGCTPADPETDRVRGHTEAVSYCTHWHPFSYQLNHVTSPFEQSFFFGPLSPPYPPNALWGVQEVLSSTCSGCADT